MQHAFLDELFCLLNLLSVRYLYLFFFFSSRRRHTRYWRDWSSDVCSSDLRPLIVQRVFGKLQIFSAAYMGWGHGFADAQKTMGIIALAIFAATRAGKLEQDRKSVV